PGAITITKAGVFSENFITYTFVVTNTGSVTLNTVAFTDANLGLNNSAVTIPAGGLVPGASVSFNYAYTLTQANKDAGTVNNTASVTARDPDNNIITDDASVAVTVIKSPIAVNDASLTFLNQPKVIEILKNDDPGNSSFNMQSIEIVTQPAHGTIQVGNGVVTYTPNPNYSGPDEFTYRVKDLYGFYTNVATVTISISPNATFKIPTLFTPNGDGINDVFEIRGIEQFAQNELSIVNRWGNEVYRQKGYQNTWAGTGLNEGTYYYILRVLDTDGTNWTVYKGYVTLIRTFKK
ncbi:MAG: gliding motility-associated C-terminal domain-containing protein, partial [Sphingobacteriales bacterium]